MKNGFYYQMPKGLVSSYLKEVIKVEAPKGKITLLTETDQLEEANHVLESLTNQEKVAVWSLLPSKTRSALKAQTSLN
jgi:hypothetical protein